MVNSRRMAGLTVVAVAAVLAGSGCTTQLKAKRIAKAGDVPVAGAPYYLPFTQFTIGITRRLTHCGPKKDENGNPLGAAIEIKVIPSITRAEAPDPQRLYVIDFDSLQGALKKTNVKVQYHPNGMLKTVNAAAEDRTGPVVIGAVTTAAKIAVSAATGGMAPASGPPPLIKCAADVTKALGIIEEKVPLLEPKAAEVTRLAGELASLTAQGQVLGRKAWPEEGQALWAKKLQALSAAQDGLIAIQSEVAGALSTLSVAEKSAFVWPSTGEDRGPTQLPVAPLTDAQIKKWGAFDEGTESKIRAAPQIFVSLTSTSPIARTKPCLAEAKPDKSDTECYRDAQAGLKYRVSAAGSLVLCMQSFDEVQCKDDQEQTCKRLVCPVDAVLAGVSGPISQLGPVFTLPLKSAVFTNKSVTAVFDEQGRPQELGVVSSAAAEEAVTTAASVTDTVLKARESVVTTRLERLKEETELLKAEKELAAAKKALETPTEAQEELVALQADTALLTARLANLEAAAALKKAQQLGGP